MFSKKIGTLIFSFIFLPIASVAVDWPTKDNSDKKFSPVLDQTTPDQVENNNIKYYIDSFDRRPFEVGKVLGKAYTFEGSNLLEAWGLPDMAHWGTYTITGPQFIPELSDIPLFTTRYAQYKVGQRIIDGMRQPALGIRPIPVHDDWGQDGYAIMDAYLLKELELKSTETGHEQIFALTAFTHPELWNSHLDELGDPSKSRLFDGFTHLGSYIGMGRTRNSPYEYHRHGWGMKDGYYPANVIQVAYDGARNSEGQVQHSLFYKNAYIALRLLNETGPNVIFSRLDWREDYYYATSLKKIFDFYRAWLDHTWIRSESDRYPNGDRKPFYEMIREDLHYDLYCSEHMDMVLNVAMNLVQTLEGYNKVFGDGVSESHYQLGGITKGGEYFYHKAQQIWDDEIMNTNGDKEAWPKMDDMANYMMLWQQTIPLVDTTLSNGANLKKGEAIPDGAVQYLDVLGMSMAWAPQTIPDFAKDVVALYERFDQFISNPVVVGGFQKDAFEIANSEESRDEIRTGLIEQNPQFSQLPVDEQNSQIDEQVQKITNEETQTQARLFSYQLTKGTLEAHFSVIFSRMAFVPRAENESDSDWEARNHKAYLKIIKPVTDIYYKYTQKLQFIISNGQVFSDVQFNADLYNHFSQEIAPYLETLRDAKNWDLSVPGKDLYYYSPPTIINRILNGNHRYNKHIHFRVLGTAFDSNQLKELDPDDSRIAQPDLDEEKLDETK